MAEQDDVLHLIDDTGTVPEDSSARKWKIAVIDDDAAVHEGTRFALSDYNLHGATLEILSAYSAAEGRTLMRDNPDVAAVLLDVIMETDVAGLDLVEYIRNELKNETVRIILRTGQPGQAPERRVIVQYDINDYKAKTELTADKLFTSLTAALRSYQQLERMVQTRRGLEIIIDAASTLYDFKSMQRLAEGVLTQLASLLNVDCAGILVLRDDGAAGSEFSVLAGSGCYSRFIGTTSSKALDPDLRQMVEAAFQRRKNEFADHRSVLYLRTGSGREVVVLLQAERQLSDTDRALVEIFSSRLSIAFDNVILYEQLQEANSRLEQRVAERTRELTAANRRLGAQWERLRRANAFKSEILGKVVVEAGARLTRSTVRGPAIIGRDAQIEDAYIGPFTSIGDGVTVRGSEVEHSILLEGASVVGVGGRIESSLIGRNASIYRTAAKPRSFNFMLGDRSEVGLI